MTEYAIRIENVRKKYRLGLRKQSYRLLSETVRDALQGLAANARGAERAADEYLWALQGVSAEIRPGEVVGVIGRNGAGKSTLLKVLARITEPTEGRVTLRGRVGSLLEVGTGFHGELTGRENIYLNGAILGMRRREIERKFDEIVDFSGVSAFLDTPVKRYSSGMYVRLAFAVAAHLDPEILLVDEVLAVGDREFQAKSLSRMQDVSREGRTVLFVSHNMPSITRLCERTILLDGGRVLQDGPSHEVVRAYLNSGLGTTAERIWADPESAPGDEVVRLRAVRVRNQQGEVVEAMDIRQPVGVEIEFDVLEPGHVLWPHFVLQNSDGTHLFTSLDQDPEWLRRPRPRGRFASTGWIPANFLAEGTMVVGAAIRTERPKKLHFYERDAVAFEMVDTLDGNSARGDYPGNFPGVIRPLLNWTTRYTSRREAQRTEIREEATGVQR